MSQTFSPRSACRILFAVIFALTLISHAAAVTETVLHQFVSQSHGAFRNRWLQTPMETCMA